MIFLHNITAAFAGMWSKREGFSFTSIRRDRCVYFMAYAFELMLYAARSEFIPVGTSLFGIGSFTWMYLGHITASLVVMLLWSEKFKYLIYISVAVMAVGFSGFFFLPDGYVRLAFAVTAYAGLGGAVTSARCGYAFAVNNLERLVGMLIMFFSVAVIYFLGTLNISGVAVTHILPIILLAGLIFCLLKFKESDLEAKEESTKSDAKGLYWALAYMIVYFALDGYNSALVSVNIDFRPGYVFLCVLLCAGMVIAGLVFFAVVIWFKKSVWHVWNLFFVFAVIMSGLAVFEPNIGTAAPRYFFNGLFLIGWPLSLYMLACAQRRFASYKLLKRSTIIFVVLSPVTTLSDDFLASKFPDALPVITMAYVLVVIVVFLMLSPYSYKHLFSVAWLSDLHKSDMELWREKVEEVDRLEQYKLTPREKQVLAFLLTAKTRRQISGEMRLSESTVKMHSSNLYKKLNINSRIELFRLFGVPESDEPTEDE